ncbi:transcriptional regulator, XRE family [Tepidicaulis marinus]|uniref:Transcriptional regulator, XRE family n=1 Tax=Tepidicaulis marinus TaxID=1333998 RepID=A0A081BFH2_9HYPH|nr:hypothetical protein [Tepidicaulis marinus]GAK46790.1 transcriptional regulator, XRE family [Tepidicaulis marinus]
MGRTLDEILASLPEDRRKDIEERAQELLTTLQEFREDETTSTAEMKDAD